MKKISYLLGMGLLAAVIGTQPVMAQGTTKQQPKQQHPVQSKKPVVQKSDTINKGQMAAVKKTDSDTMKKGQNGVRHTRRHHVARKHVTRKTVTKTVTKKPGEK